MAEEDYEASLDEMNKIVALQREHDLTLPDAFHFKYAQAAFSAGSMQAALDSVSQYLTASGRDGEFYREAIELLEQVELTQTLLDEYPAQVEQLMAEEAYDAALELMDRIAALQEEHNLTLPDEFRSRHVQVAWFAQPCAGQPKGAACWMEVANQPECYVWWNLKDAPYGDRDLLDGRVCREPGSRDGNAHLGHGRGLPGVDGLHLQAQDYGINRNLQEGQRHGDWVERYATGEAEARVEKGPYVDGKQHGRWVLRYKPTGEVSWVTIYVNGEEISSVMY